MRALAAERLSFCCAQLNPVIGYFDPLKLAEGEFWGDSNEATIGFLREVRIAPRVDGPVEGSGGGLACVGFSLLAGRENPPRPLRCSLLM